MVWNTQRRPPSGGLPYQQKRPEDGIDILMRTIATMPAPAPGGVSVLCAVPPHTAGMLSPAPSLASASASASADCCHTKPPADNPHGPVRSTYISRPKFVNKHLESGMKREFDGRRSPGRYPHEAQSPSAPAYGPSPIPNLPQWQAPAHPSNNAQNQLPPSVQPLSDIATSPDHPMSQAAANPGLRAPPYSYQIPPHQFLTQSSRFGPQGASSPYGYKQGAAALPQLSFLGATGPHQQQQQHQHQQQPEPSAQVQAQAQPQPPVSTPVAGISGPLPAGPVNMNMNMHVHGHTPVQLPIQTAGGASDPPVHSAGDFGPERQRARVNKACDRCRAHKIKCSGIMPCAHCTKHGSECRFRASVAADDAGGKSGPKRESNAEANAGPMVGPVAETNAGSNAGANAGANAEPTHSYAYAAYGVAEAQDAAGPADESRANGNGGVPPPKRMKVSPSPEDAVGAAPERSDASYIAYLENRVRHLESVVAAHTSSTSSRSTNTSAAFRLEDVVQIQAPHSTKWRLCARYQGALAVKLCASLYEGLSPEAQAQVEVPRLNYFGFNMSGCHYLTPPELPALPDVGVLSAEQRLALVDYFLREINPLFAIVHEKVFREQFQVFLGILSDARPTNQTSLFAAMACLVSALALRFTEFAKPAGPCMQMLDLEEQLFKYSHRVISVFSFEWESFELIQCWLLAALYLRVAHRQTSCHHALGQAMTMCRSMGLGRHERIGNTATAYEQIKARRIFYTVYTFDRVLGLQGGKIAGIGDHEIAREFPSLDYERERGTCDWLTRPAFAMLHIARLANYLSISHSNEYDEAAAQKMHREFAEFRAWLDAHGFSDAPGGGSSSNMQDWTGPMGSDCSLAVKMQVKCHFYELVHCVHGRALFGFLGHRVAIEGLQFRTLLQCNVDSVRLLQQAAAAGTLYAPWYLTLQLLLTVGINSLVFIQGGVHVAQSRRLLQDAMGLIHTLRRSPVYNAEGKKVFKRRFKMVEECHWLLKMMCHIMALHHEEAVAGLRELGFDHGSSDVNQCSLKFDNGPAGPAAESNPEGRLGKLMSSAVPDPAPKANGLFSRVFSENTSDTTYEDSLSQPDGLSYPIDRYLDNLAWFDQWLDFNHEA